MSEKTEDKIEKHPCLLEDGTYDHDPQWISDWYGDPEVINGTAKCSRCECSVCGEILEGYSASDFDYDYED